MLTATVTVQPEAEAETQVCCMTAVNTSAELKPFGFECMQKLGYYTKCNTSTVVQTCYYIDAFLDIKML